MSCEVLSQWCSHPLDTISNDSTTWCYTYLAHLSLTTPLRRLRQHGKTLIPEYNGQSPSAPENSDVDPDGQWMLFLDQSEAEDESFSTDTVTHDLAEQPVTTMTRYHAFLMEFRAIIEDDTLLPSGKRTHLNELIASQRYPDVIYALGNGDWLINACLPDYLLYLADCGVSPADVQALRLAGITSQWALAHVSTDDLDRITGRCDVANTPDDPLTQYWTRCHNALANLSGDQPHARLILHDPVIQILY